MRMEKDAVREGETPARLSARLGAPICAILRANRLACTAWLTPGREIAVQGPGFCGGDAFPCPARLVETPARERPAEAFTAAPGDSLASVALALGTSERLILLALGRAAGPLREGERFVLDSEQTGARVRTALPGERLADLCADTAAAARVNRLEGERIFPGMRVVLPRGDPKERQR